MRITEREAAAIRLVATEVAGKDARVALFGSRTQDELRGGDIDLLIDARVPHLPVVVNTDRADNSEHGGQYKRTIHGGKKGRS